MDEARIKALYRGAARREPALDDALAEDIEAVLTGYGWPADEMAPIDRVATSTTAAAITRVVAELAPEARQLSQDLRQARVVPASRSATMLRGGFSVAAGVAAVALLFTLLPGPSGLPDTASPTLNPSEVISAISFEADAGASDHGMANPNDGVIFSGNFDS